VYKITILLQKIIFFPIAKGGAKIFGVFRVKNHDFTPKNDIFSILGGGGGEARRVRLPLDPPLESEFLQKLEPLISHTGILMTLYLSIILDLQNFFH
jgi:hypothetical protein